MVSYLAVALKMLIRIPKIIESLKELEKQAKTHIDASENNEAKNATIAESHHA